MAGPNLCVSCTPLTAKSRSTAVKSERCPNCQAEIGMTAYGARFRIVPAKRKKLLSPSVFKGMTVGAGLFAFASLMIGLTMWITEKTDRPARPADPLPPEDLSHIPEVALLDPFPKNTAPDDAKRRLSNLITKIRDANAVKQDGFMLAQIDLRKELRGLPFVMGDACRSTGERARSFQSTVQAVRNGMTQDSGPQQRGSNPPVDQNHSTFWNTYLAETAGQGANTEPGIAALSQILAPERRTLRTSLVRKMALSNSPQATKVLARAAVFDPANEVRTVALSALKDRPREEYADILMLGIRYPLAVVSKRSAVAMILLDCKDLLPQLVDFLGEASPGDPVESIVNEQKVSVVREVVRVNHHRNCLMCHAPTSTGSTEEVPGVLPIPGSPFPSSPSEAYGAAQSVGDPMIRADTTYLRQDFSVMMPVENAAPWPQMQRFDFLIRNRVVAGKELAALQQQLSKRPADYLSENHKSALRVLHELTGQVAEPTQAAWQQVLGLAPTRK